jgi:hypothetical protein
MARRVSRRVLQDLERQKRGVPVVGAGITCPACGKESPANATLCHHCNLSFRPEPSSAGDAPSEPSAPRTSRSLSTQQWIAIGVVVSVVLVGLLGSLHVVEYQNGVSLIPKVHWTLAETFVSLDAITGMPWIAARTRWPLACKALQKAGMLESDEAFEQRIQEETERKIREEMQRLSPP